MAMISSRASGIALGLSLLLAARGLDAQGRHDFTGLHMGVAVRIALYAPSDNVAREAAHAAFERIAELDDRMSADRPHSEARLLAEHPWNWQTVRAGVVD